MEHPANGPLRGPEDMLALAEHLAARCAPGGHLLALRQPLLGSHILLLLIHQVHLCGGWQLCPCGGLCGGK